MNSTEEQHTEQSDNDKPKAYQVNDDSNLEEKDLKRSFTFGGEDADPDQKGYESHGYGGQNFGKTNVTTSGDDAANPSQNAGYSNDYFKRTEPLEEHPENINFKPQEQQGAPNPDGEGEIADQIIQEGTADYDGGTQKYNPGGNNPEQNKSGSGDQEDKITAAQDKKPDYGSADPEEEYPNRL